MDICKIFRVATFIATAYLFGTEEVGLLPDNEEEFAFSQSNLNAKTPYTPFDFDCKKTAKTQAETGCGQDLQSVRLGLRYTTPRGVGYRDGYMTLEGFFAPRNALRNHWLPFLDLRGHIFDDGKLAANAALGCRYITSSRIWGGFASYDYRDTKHQHYNQISLGIESLGRVWDFRMNGYLPVGKKRSPYYRAKFYRFQGHEMLVRQTYDFAMKGANAEAGLHVDRFKKTPLYFAAGPYYLTGDKTTWGGNLRASVDLLESFVRIEGNVSYDHLFKWIGQAQASFNISLGRKDKKRIQNSCSRIDRRTALQNSCSRMDQRIVQRMGRSEIIPIDTSHAIAPAIDPATGEPWFFWFVNNTSASNGTYESPYPMLATVEGPSAPNQVIYVYPGDGTTHNMSSGIALKEAQWLFGASVPHPIPTTVGTVTIPPLASIPPTITNTVGNIVTLANNNIVSGFNLQLMGGNGVFGSDISNFTASQNAFHFTAADPSTNGIDLFNPTGQILINNCTFGNTSSTSAAASILVSPTTNFLAVLSVSECAFGSINDTSAGNIYANLSGSGSIGTFVVSKCTFGSIDSSSGILASLAGSGSIETLIASECAFDGAIGGGSLNAGVAAILYNAGSLNAFTVSDCDFSSISTAGGYGAYVDLHTGTGSLGTLKTSGCTFSSIAGGGIGIGTKNESGGTGSLGALTVSRCTFSNIEGLSFGISTTPKTTQPSTLSISRCIFGDINTGSGIQASLPDASTASINALTVSRCAFEGTISNGGNGILAALSGSGGLGTFTASGCSFQAINNSNGIEATLSNTALLGTFTTSECTFNDISGSASNGIRYLNESTGNSANSPAVVQIFENTFTGTGSGLAIGFAANVSVQAGTSCVNFTDNFATPTNTPYSFTQVNPGAFNLAPYTGNIGSFSPPVLITPVTGCP